MQLMVINTYYILSSYMTSGGDVIVTPHAFSIDDHRYSLSHKTSSGDDSVRCPHLLLAISIGFSSSDDDFGDGDIYIMMQFCLFVTKNEHFLVGFHGFSR